MGFTCKSGRVTTIPLLWSAAYPSFRCKTICMFSDNTDDVCVLLTAYTAAFC